MMDVGGYLANHHAHLLVRVSSLGKVYFPLCNVNMERDTFPHLGHAKGSGLDVPLAGRRSYAKFVTDEIKQVWEDRSVSHIVGDDYVWCWL